MSCEPGQGVISTNTSPSAFLVYLFLWRLTHGAGSATAQVALRDVAENTGLSKRGVPSALSWLVKRKLIAVARASITAIPVYTVNRPWLRRYAASVCLRDFACSRVVSSWRI